MSAGVVRPIRSARVLRVSGPSIAGISGGRTSGRMAYLLPSSTVLCFQNTGREHSKTYDFLQKLEDDLQRTIVRLEFRAPPRGDAPKNATTVVVPHRELARRGEPFRDLLECLASFRKKQKGLDPIAPWARQRICTAYLKIKTQRRYALSTFRTDDYVQFVGLRADEPARVALMRERNEARDTDERAPLFDLGVTKKDVLDFWRTKSFQLNLPEHLGNCTGCFLKDERDLADAMLDEETDAAWWIRIEQEFAPMRRGRPSYAQVFAEAHERLVIREAMRSGVEPASSGLPPHRHRLVVRQERAPREAWSCGCEGAERMEDDDLLADGAS